MSTTEEKSKLKPLATQIAGHSEEDGGSQNLPGFLSSDDGFVYKPVPGKRGQNEVDFYESFHTLDPILQSFVPEYKGLTEVNNTRYMGIANATHGFKIDEISLCDIKIGTKTYGSDASEEKIRLEEAKCAKTTTSSLGIRFCGAKLFDPSTKAIVKLDKDWGKKLKIDNIFDQGIKKFFTHSFDEKISKAIIKEFLVLLNQLLDYFKSINRTRGFYSSSLLFVYGIIDKSIQPTPSSIKIVQDHPQYGISLKMIDFAHVDSIHGKDEGYIFGLENLIEMVNRL
ncbi:hypothetical protein CYY_006974 [Polysphondylium violaceum]|uniref:Kinase n=1 Tax=Polysphondylium violaceum TaxID=133409 RepID=A0A8J4UYC1_9MYCE|nr:hypothetical protein CYY_006974 [Polysphondylium violaceum]